MRTFALTLLVGCTGDLSNAVFVEDAAFRQALPDWSTLRPQYPSTLVIDPSDTLHLGAWTQGSLDLCAALQGSVEQALFPVATSSPTERGEDWRSWGPYPWDAVPGSFLVVDMSRSADHSLTSYGLAGALTSSGPFSEFFAGSWASSEGVDGWQGRVDWDWDSLAQALSVDSAGSVWLQWRLGDLPTLRVEGLDARYGEDLVLDEQRVEVALPPEGGGALTVEGSFDLDPRSGAPEELNMASSWDSAGYGRASVDVYGGDLGVNGNHIEQCWAPDGTLLWAIDERGWLQPLGEEADCGSG